MNVSVVAGVVPHTIQTSMGAAVGFLAIRRCGSI